MEENSEDLARGTGRRCRLPRAGKRAIQRQVQDPLALLLLHAEVLPGDHIVVDVDQGSFERPRQTRLARARRQAGSLVPHRGAKKIKATNVKARITPIRMNNQSPSSGPCRDGDAVRLIVHLPFLRRLPTKQN